MLAADLVRKVPVNYNQLVRFRTQDLQDLSWWIEHSHLYNSAPILTSPISQEITTDASLTGWGVTNSIENASGAWDAEERQSSINLLELKAAFFDLRMLATPGTHVLIRMDNRSAKAYVSKKGGTRSLQLCQLALQLWDWCFENQIMVTAEHLPGKDNIIADALSRSAEHEPTDSSQRM